MKTQTPSRIGAPRSNPYVFSVSSGKGGVGKTNIVINLAVELRRRGQKVLIFDADLGLSNVPVLLGAMPEYDLSHILFGQLSMRDVLFQGPEGVMILPAGSGVQELAALSEEQQMRLISETEMLEEEFDVVLVDTGAGISPNVIFFNIVSQDNIIVVYPEPAAIADAYALIKILALRHNRKRFKILLNGIRGEAEAAQILDRISLACHRFLGVSVSYLGAIPYDDHIRRSIRAQQPVVKKFPNAESSQCFCQLAGDILSADRRDTDMGSLRFFWNRLFSSEGSSFVDSAMDLSSSQGLG